MDPNANRAEQLRLASRLVESFDNERPIREDDAARLAELVIALDEWISGEGFPPDAWARKG
jgi:hypothetical protein